MKFLKKRDEQLNIFNSFDQEEEQFHFKYMNFKNKILNERNKNCDKKLSLR